MREDVPNEPVQPQWKPYVKHMALKVPWKKAIDATRRPGSARYHPSVNQKELEMRCLAEGRVDEAALLTQGIREYWMDCEQVIGASLGKETTFVFVQWQVCGDVNEVHGRPITLQELRNRGMGP